MDISPDREYLTFCQSMILHPLRAAMITTLELSSWSDQAYHDCCLCLLSIVWCSGDLWQPPGTEHWCPPVLAPGPTWPPTRQSSLVRPLIPASDWSPGSRGWPLIGRARPDPGLPLADWPLAWPRSGLRTKSHGNINIQWLYLYWILDEYCSFTRNNVAF